MRDTPAVFYYDDKYDMIPLEYTESFDFKNIGNYYGHLEVYLVVDEYGVAYYWGIQDWDGCTEVEQIPLTLGNELYDFHKSLKSNKT